jgi:hypothetical protein
MPLISCPADTRPPRYRYAFKEDEVAESVRVCPGGAVMVRYGVGVDQRVMRDSMFVKVLSRERQR